MASVQLTPDGYGLATPEKSQSALAARGARLSARIAASAAADVFMSSLLRSANHARERRCVRSTRDPIAPRLLLCKALGLPGLKVDRQVPAKSTVIEGRGGKSGGCAGKAVGLTSGELRRVRESGLSASQGARSRRRSQQRA
jgi:hypothetical protein